MVERMAKALNEMTTQVKENFPIYTYKGQSLCVCMYVRKLLLQFCTYPHMLYLFGISMSLGRFSTHLHYDRTKIKNSNR